MAAKKKQRQVLVVFGTRPEAIKLAPVIHALRDDGSIGVKICVTAQHREMLDQVLALFEIRPDYDLDLMQPDQTLADLTSRTVFALSEVLKDGPPECVVVQGDTTTTFAASLAAFYARVPVAHVEAGLRTGNFEAPWPEEMNRVLTSSLARFHFAPTDRARRNLLGHGVPRKQIHVTGNTVVDALLQVRQKLAADPALTLELNRRFEFLDPGRKMLLVTGHRRESFGEGLKSICQALADLTDRHDDIEIVYPLHLNPNVQGPVSEILQNRSRIFLIDPTDYVTLVYLLSRCYFVMTDSGGIQEEAPTFGKPVLVLRETTERPEGIEAGNARLVGTERKKIVKEAEALLSDRRRYEKMSTVRNPYGDGKASQRIVAVLRKAL